VPVGFGQTRAAKLLPVLTMVCGYSRFALAMLLPSRSAKDLYAGCWQLTEQLITHSKSKSCAMPCASGLTGRTFRRC
jgi:hypothetical protein